MKTQSQVNQKIDTAKEKLAALLLQVSNKSNSEILKSLKSEIKAARKAGKSWSQIKGALDEAGIQVSIPTLAKPFSDAKKACKAGNKKEKTKTKTIINAGKTEQKGSVPPPLTAGTFTIRPDRGADL